MGIKDNGKKNVKNETKVSSKVIEKGYVKIMIKKVKMYCFYIWKDCEIC